MAMKIQFDQQNNPLEPALVLGKKSGELLGQINATDIVIRSSLNDYAEISFSIYKYKNGEKDYLWDDIRDFRLLYCPDFDKWFEIYVSINETNNDIKTVSCVELANAELSQINLYNIQINTEDDIARDDYVVTVLYNPSDADGSLLNRIMEKANHYTIKHVDSTIASIQRTFEFDGTSLLDAFNEIAEEIGCIFIYEYEYDSGSLTRYISVYDLQTTCNECGYRGDYHDTCPECGSTDLTEGYGDDTTIFITADELGKDISFDTDEGSVKNCFKLIAGDDLMTATIANCNPNGSDYLWYIPDYMREDMSDELQEKLTEYEELYEYYQDEYEAILPTDSVTTYNEIVTKYQEFDPDIEELETTITGYPALMNAYYNTIDLDLYLESELMPSVDIDDTDAETEAAKLTTDNLSPVSVTDVSIASSSTVNNAVLSIAKIVVNANYKVTIDTSSYSSQTWTGNFIVTNYSDEEDTATSDTISITIDDDYENFIEQKIEKLLNKENTDDYSVTSLFALDLEDFTEELTKYALNPLSEFYTVCQSCLDILVEQGIGDEESWDGSDPNLYDDLYVPYYNKLNAIEEEMALRQAEVDAIIGVLDSDGTYSSYGTQNYIVSIRDSIQDTLDFETYLGTTLWLEFGTFRRDNTYQNDNFISDGLTNSEIFTNAQEFLQQARNEIYKSAELQHTISAGLKDLLVIQKFQPLVDYFEVGNWLRILVDDTVYKLRLIQYEINYSDLSSINVDFSDVLITQDGISDQQSVINQAQSMASSYGSVSRQASQGSSSHTTLEEWREYGLNTALYNITNNTNEEVTFDKLGLLCRSYDDVTETYSDEQFKITHNVLCFTDDNWETVRTALGKFSYYDVTTSSEVTDAYGLNADFVIAGYIQGSTIVGNNIYGGVLYKYDEDTQTVDTSTYIDLVNGKFSLGDNTLIYDGSSLTINGTITAGAGSTIGGFNITSSSIYNTQTSLTGTSAGVYIGTDGIGLGAGKFYVTSSGTLVANSATISGTINATGGTFSGSITASGTISGGTITGATITGGSFTTTESDEAYTMTLGNGEIDLGNGAVIYGPDPTASMSTNSINIYYSTSNIDVSIGNNVEIARMLDVGSDIYGYGNLSITGTKSRIAETDNYNQRLLYCYETSTPMFGDIGEGITDDTGECYVFFDDIFSETINLDCSYQVFLQLYGEGSLYVSERNATYFIVKGTEHLSFGWEVKAFQKNYETYRLETYEKDYGDNSDVLSDTTTYLENILEGE